MKVTLEEAAFCLKQGGNVVVPTETVYGLAASLYQARAISNIFTIKARPQKNPLIVHVYGQSDLFFAKQDLPDFQKLIDSFWPGPLTLLLPLLQTIDRNVTAGLESVAVRSPSHPLCRRLLSITGPLVAPSANPSGKPSPTRPQHVERDYGGQLALLDGGICQAGVESTILGWDPFSEKWVLARFGALAPESLEKVLGYCLERRLDPKEAICPGQQWRHYAPKAELFLLQNYPKIVQKLVSGSVLIGFQEREYGTAKVYRLGSLQDPEGCLRELYQTLRLLDEDRIDSAWVDCDFPCDWLWQTVRERLQKAAAKK